MADLKPGGMGQAAFTGVPPEFVGSMAQAMEDAYRQLLVDDGKESEAHGMYGADIGER